MTVVLLAGFVFSLDWTIPLAALLVAADAALGDSGPIPRLFRSLIAPRLRAAPTLEPVAAVRTHALLVGGALVLATILLYGGAAGLARLLAILVALVTALCATGLLCAGCELHRRRSGG